MAVFQVNDFSSIATYLSLLALTFAVYLLPMLRKNASRVLGHALLRTKLFSAQDGPAGMGAESTSRDGTQNEQLRMYKNLYFKLQNLEDHPEVLSQAYAHLTALLGQSLLAEQSTSSPSSILSVRSYSSGALRAFLINAHNSVLSEYEEYVRRRESGGGPQLFPSRKEAEVWLLKHAPVKYVDGAWLSRIHSVATPFAFDKVTSKAFQILSEELGDGDIEKNHVRVYRQLVESAGHRLPAGNTLAFTQDGLGMDELQPWKAAVGQLLISLFPSDFLAEALGFNLQYEMLTLETLQATRELPMYGLSALYHLLHVSIDNADSGHTAIALDIVIQYLEIIQQREGCAAMQEAWKRVQAGYVLSKSLACENNSDEVWPAELGENLIQIFKRKASVSHKLHCRSRARLGTKTLTDWLSPEGWTDIQEQQARLRALADAAPWVIKGHPEKSLLLRELSWRGKMYGAFTTAEVRLLRQWILSLDRARPTYEQLVGPIQKTDLSRQQTLLGRTLTNAGRLPQAETIPVVFNPHAPIKATNAPPAIVFSLWFVHPCLLENALSVPHTTSEKLSTYVLRLTKAEQGFGSDTQLSLSQLGMDMMRRHNFQAPSCLEDVLEENTIEFANCLLSWSMRPQRHIGFLLGLARAFLDFETWVAKEGFLDEGDTACLNVLLNQKRQTFQELLSEPKVRVSPQFIGGYESGRLAIETMLGGYRRP